MIIAVKRCRECPFLTNWDDKQRCNVSNPKGRPLALEEFDRPSFCPLRREKVIVQEAS